MNCCDLTLVGSQATQLLSHFPQRGGEQNQKGKSEKNSWVETNTVKQKLHIQAKQNKELIHYFTLAGKRSAIASKAEYNNNLGRQTPLLWMSSPSCSTFSLALIAVKGLSTKSRRVEHPFGQLSRLCPLLVHLWPPCWQHSMRNREGLHAVWALLSNN